MEKFAQPQVNPAEQNPGFWNKTRAKAGGVLLAALAVGGGAAVALGSAEAANQDTTPTAESTSSTGHPCNTIVRVCPPGPNPTDTIKVTTTETPTTPTTPQPTVPPTAPPTTGEGGPTPTPARPPETTVTTMDLAPSH